MLVESFQRAADARGDDRNTAGHRLQDHNTERFDPRRQHEQIGIGEERRNVIDPTAKRHAIPDPEPRGQRLQRAAFGSVAADLQPERRALRGRVRSRMQQNIEPLLVNEPAEGLDHAVRLSRRLGALQPAPSNGNAGCARRDRPARRSYADKPPDPPLSARTGRWCGSISTRSSCAAWPVSDSRRTVRPCRQAHWRGPCGSAPRPARIAAASDRSPTGIADPTCRGSARARTGGPSADRGRPWRRFPPHRWRGPHARAMRPPRTGR